MDDIGKVERAYLAQQIIENPVFLDSFDELKASMFRQLEQCKIGDADSLVQIHTGIKTLDKIRMILINHINTGKSINVRSDYIQEQHKRESDVEMEIVRRLQATGNN